MLSKLALRNVMRSARDYLVYFLTMTVVSAIMFAFHSLLFSKEIQQLFEMAVIFAVLVGLATFFVVLIVAWLINYMVRFILEKRSREFGIYLLIGMKKKEISRLYMRESLLLGAAAFAAADPAGNPVQHDHDGIPSQAGMERWMPYHHGRLLWRMLPAGPSPVQRQIPEDEHPCPDGQPETE